MSEKEVKPLRHEEYMAMAEELRLLKEENARLMGHHKVVDEAELKWKLERRRRLAKFAGKLLKFVAIAAAVLIACSTFVSACSKIIQNGRQARALDQNPDPCYFTRQRQHENHKNDPWERWFLYKSKYDGFPFGRVNSCVSEDSSSCRQFVSKDEAWGFMQKWNLPACK